MRHAITRRRVLAGPFALAIWGALGGLRPSEPIAGSEAGEDATAVPTATPETRREAILTAAYDALPSAPAAISLTRLNGGKLRRVRVTAAGPLGSAS